MTKNEKQMLKAIQLLVNALDNSTELSKDLSEMYRKSLTKYDFVQSRVLVAAWMAERRYTSTAYDLMNEAIQYLVAEAGGLSVLQAKLTLAFDEETAKLIMSRYTSWTALFSNATAAISFYRENRTNDSSTLV